MRLTFFRTNAFWIPLFVACLAISSPGYAQPNASKEAGPESTKPVVSIDIVQRKLENLGSDTSEDKDAKASLEALYRKTLSHLEKIEEYEQTLEDLIRVEKEAAGRIKTLRQQIPEIEKTSPTASLKNLEDRDLENLEALLTKEKADLAAVEAKYTKANETLKYHTERPQQIRQRLIEANREADGIAEKFKPGATEDRPELKEAKRWALESQAKMLADEIRMLDRELLSHPVRIDLYKAELKKAEKELDFLTTRVEYLNKYINTKRQARASEVRVETEKAQQKSVGQHPLISELANRNITLSDYINQITSDLSKVTEQEKSINSQASKIDQDYKKTKQKLDIAGMSKVLGRVMQEQRRMLPDFRPLRDIAKDLENKIADVSLKQIEYRDEQTQLEDLDNYLDSYMANVPADEREKIRNDIEKLVKDRAEYINQAISIQESYIRALNEVDFSITRLLEAIDKYEDFLDERLLWVRNMPPVSLETFEGLTGQVAELLSPDSWMEVLKSLTSRVRNFVFMFFTLLAIGIILWKESSMRAALIATGGNIGKPSRDSIFKTLEAFQWTILIALPLPLLMYVSGSLLNADVTASLFTKSVARALLLTAEGVFILRIFSIACTEQGIAAQHFKWPLPTVKRLHKNINILIYLFLPLAFIAMLANYSNISEQGVGLGRGAFVLMMAALMVFLYRVFSPSDGALRSLNLQQKPALISIRYLWFTFAVLLPLLAAVLAIAGYMYTAGTLVKNHVETLWLFLALVVIHQFAVRWIRLTRERMALQAKRAKREAAQKSSESPADGIATADKKEQQNIESPTVDLKALSDDNRRLLNLAMIILGVFGLWYIWSDILPAFGIFDRFALYDYQITDKEGGISYQTITLADIGQVLIIAIVAILVLRRLPAFIEMILSQKTRVTPGSRYAINSLVKYTLIGIFTVIIFDKLGGSWSQFQWIFAALGVGIGFGLQEIVANFISGIIILFERPIRVGDMVTVGDVTGTVTKIRIRATTIRDWDRKELLVPNKEFITGRLLNWSLSDTVTRITIPVGIAYGSDVDKAMELVEESARENKKIIDDPAPVVTFESFGDNSLLILARVYIDNLDNRIPVTSEMHVAINRKFNEAGIVIAFPQRDVHLDTSSPLDIRIRREKKGASDADE